MKQASKVIWQRHWILSPWVCLTNDQGLATSLCGEKSSYHPAFLLTRHFAFLYFVILLIVPLIYKSVEHVFDLLWLSTHRVITSQIEFSCLCTVVAVNFEVADNKGNWNFHISQDNVQKWWYYSQFVFDNKAHL